MKLRKPEFPSFEDFKAGDCVTPCGPFLCFIDYEPADCEGYDYALEASVNFADTNAEIAENTEISLFKYGKELIEFRRKSGQPVSDIEPKLVRVCCKKKDFEKVYNALVEYVTASYEDYVLDNFFIASNKRPVICTTADNDLFGCYESVSDASRDLKITTSDISAVCRGKLDSIRGFRFYYGTEDDYVNGKIGFNNSPARTQHGGKVEQIKNGQVVNVFDSVSDAARSVSGKSEPSHISAVCKGKRKSAYGYQWRYAKG